MKKALVFAMFIIVSAVSARADFNTGFNAYLKGDFTTAFKELSPEANQGNSKAQFALGLMYQQGKGVDKDSIQAYKWYGLAETQGHKLAPKNKGGVAKNMTPEEIQKAERLIAQFKPSTIPAPVVEAPKPAKPQPEPVKAAREELKTPESAPAAPAPQTTVKEKVKTAEPQPTSATAAVEKKPTLSFWQGKFSCKKNPEEMMFRLTTTPEGQALKGILIFDPTWRNPHTIFANQGALKMEGTLDSGTGQFQLQPKGWVRKSSRQPFSISGVIAKGGETMSGRSSDKNCSEFKARHFDLFLSPPNPKGLLFKAAADHKSLTDEDCLAYAKWLNSGKEIKLPEGGIMSQILDDEGMRKLLGRSLFQWRPKEDRGPYYAIFNGCKSKSRGTFNIKLSDEASLVKQWVVFPLYERPSSHYWSLVQQSYLAVYDARTLAAEQKIHAEKLPPALESYDTLAVLLVKARKKEGRIAWLPKEDMEAHQALLTKRQADIARQVVDESAQKLQALVKDPKANLDSLKASHYKNSAAFQTAKFPPEETLRFKQFYDTALNKKAAMLVDEAAQKLQALVEDSKTDLNSLKTSYDKRLVALQHLLPQKEAQRFKQAYDKAVKKKSSMIVLASLPAKTTALADFQDADVSRLNELMKIENEAKAIRKIADLGDPEVKKVVDAYIGAYDAAWTSIVDKSSQKIEALVDDPKAGLDSLQASHDETWSAVKPHIPPAQGQRFQDSYNAAVKKKGAMILLANLPEKTKAVAELKKADIKKRKELADIDAQAQAIIKPADMNNPEVKQAVDAYNQEHDAAWAAMLDNSVKFVESELNKAPTLADRVAAVDYWSKELFGTGTNDIPGKYAKIKSMLVNKRNKAEKEQNSGIIVMAEAMDKLAKYNVDQNDTVVTKNKKKRAFEKALAQINRSAKSKKVNFSNLCVEDVIPEKVLTRIGKAQEKKLYAQVGGKDLQHPMARALLDMQLSLTCPKCFRETGKYNVKFWVPKKANSCRGGSFRRPEVMKLTKNEDEAAEYRKNQAYPVSGKVNGIYYDNKITLKLE